MIADQPRQAVPAADIAPAAAERQESDVLFLLHDGIVDRDRLDGLEVGFQENVLVGPFRTAFPAGRRGRGKCRLVPLEALKAGAGPYHEDARIPEMASRGEILLGDPAFGLFSE